MCGCGSVLWTVPRTKITQYFKLCIRAHFQTVFDLFEWEASMNRFAYLLAGSQRKRARLQCKHSEHLTDSSEKWIWCDFCKNNKRNYEFWRIFFLKWIVKKVHLSVQNENFVINFYWINSSLDITQVNQLTRTKNTKIMEKKTIPKILCLLLHLAVNGVLCMCFISILIQTIPTNI